VLLWDVSGILVVVRLCLIHPAVLVSGSLEALVPDFFGAPLFEFHVREDIGKPTGHQIYILPPSYSTALDWYSYIVVANSNTFVCWFLRNTVETNRTTAPA
jgi:hypothetical protein